MRIFIVVFLFLIGVQSHAAEKTADTGIILPPGIWECHGSVTLRGQTAPERFWLRLLMPDPALGRHRLMQLVYTPPSVTALGGTHLADTPFVLLDARSLVVAWNDRGSSTVMQPGKATYVVSRDRTPSDHSNIILDEHKITGERGWDRTIAPLLLALAWRRDTSMSMPCIDFFGDEPATTMSWQGEAARCGTDVWRIEADGQGRLQSLKQVRDGATVTVLTVAEWLATGTGTTSPESK